MMVIRPFVVIFTMCSSVGVIFLPPYLSILDVMYIASLTNMIVAIRSCRPAFRLRLVRRICRRLSGWAVGYLNRGYV
jgi:hypothetical protein